MLKLIPDWRQAYKFLSVQLALLIVILGGLQEFLPELKEILPEHWYQWIAGAAILGRVLAQPALLSSTEKRES